MLTSKHYRPIATTTEPNATIVPQSRDPNAYPLIDDALADFEADGDAAAEIELVFVAPVVEVPDAAAAVDDVTLDNAASLVKAAVRPLALTHALGADGFMKLTAPHCDLSQPRDHHKERTLQP